MTGALAGVRVLVTRPAEQAIELARRVEAEGGEAIVFPVLAIEPSSDHTALVRTIGSIAKYDIVVFVSRNAVEHGFYLMAGAAEGRPRVAAIGPSTARALEDVGLTVHIRATSGFTSEALLAEPALQQVSGQRVLIVRGQGGRELLAESLTARGAEVSYAEVYARELTDTDAAELHERWKMGGIDLVTVLSVETLDALCKRLGHDGMPLLRRTRLVTASARVIKRAAALGLAGVVTAKGPDDGALIAAMIAWRRARRPAGE